VYVGARVGAEKVVAAVGAPKPPKDVNVGARVVLEKVVGARNDALVYVAEGMVAVWKEGAGLKEYVGANGAATVDGEKNGDATDGAK
jgi:hypothetical protein